MNERMKQLMLEADYAAPEIALRAQKLVELVILECDRYARSTWEHGHLLGGDLKRLFGVGNEQDD
jgi:hypothetical protein